MPTRGTDSYMGFVGVSTGGSSIRQVFPEWADALGLPTRTLVGHDVPLDSAAAVYREVVETIRDDPQHRGALVTTHKMAVHAAARDLFDDCDELAETFGEISCIAKRGDRLVGSAKDPVTARLALEEFVAPDHFARTGGAALILGSGGAGTALSHQLGVRGDRPGEIICTALTPEPLDHARQIHERAGRAGRAGPLRGDARAATTSTRCWPTLPPASLVVNATGMGKDRPGSPMPDATPGSPSARWSGSSTTAGRSTSGTRRWPSARSGSCTSRTAGATSCTAGARPWPRSSTSPMPAETVDELGRIAARLR